MTELNKTEKWIVREARAYLAYDAAHPNVGMGMHYGTAVDEAIETAKTEAAVFDGRLMTINKEAILDEVYRQECGRERPQYK